MEKYLTRPIKEIITEFPKIGKILEEYNIGCVPCALGSCLLKDVVSIHNLPKSKEIELMYRIEKELYPEREVKKSVINEEAEKAAPKEIKYSPPVKRLVDEHVLIKKWVGLIPAALKAADLNTESGRQLLQDGLDFIKYYADKLHHAKEEDILFDYADRNSDIIKTMLADHESARAHVRAAREAIEKRDKRSVEEHLKAYKELLSEHIKKEDEILYPWIDRGLSTSQVGELFSRFKEADENARPEVVKRCEMFAAGIEQRIEQLGGVK